MFDHLEERARRIAVARATRKRDAIAAGLSAALPGGIDVETMEDGVRLTGRGLRRRAALDPRVRAALGDLG